MTRVLVIDDDVRRAQVLTGFLASREYQVDSCAGIRGASEAVAQRRPHVLVLVPPQEAERHERLEELRRAFPRIPVVVVTLADGPELILDVEAFAPTLPARPSRNFASIASAVEAASAIC